MSLWIRRCNHTYMRLYRHCRQLLVFTSISRSCTEARPAATLSHRRIMLFDIFALFFLVLSQLCAWTAWSELPFEGPARKHFRSHAQHSLAWLRRNTYLFTENWRPARLTSGASTTNRCEAAIAMDDDDSTAIQHPWTQAQPTRTWLRRKLHLFTENWRPVWPRVDASCTRSCNAALVAEDCGHPADQHTQRSQQIPLSKMHVIRCVVWCTIMVCIVDLRGFQRGVCTQPPGGFSVGADTRGPH